MIIVPNKQAFYKLKGSRISGLVLEDEILEIALDNNKRLLVDMALFRIYDKRNLYLSGWDCFLGKDFSPYCCGDNLATISMPSVNNLLKNSHIKKVAISRVGDLSLTLSNQIYIEVLINCFCKESYYYKLVDGSKEMAVIFYEN